VKEGAWCAAGAVPKIRAARLQEERCDGVSCWRPYRRGRVGLRGDDAAVAERGLLAARLVLELCQGAGGGVAFDQSSDRLACTVGAPSAVGLRGVRPGES
jgi:hypothetical protein